jgi:hypothetical protein
MPRDEPVTTAARPVPGTVAGLAVEVWAEAVPLRASAAGAAAASAMKVRRELSVSDIGNVSFSRIAKARGYGRGRFSDCPRKLKSVVLGCSGEQHPRAEAIV